MARTAPGGGDGGINGVRALAVIVAMVIVALVVLAKLGGGTRPHGVAVTGHTGGATTTTTLLAPPPPTSATTVVPPAQIKVQVLNGLLTGTLASQWNAKLKTKGYMTGVPDNATVKTSVSAIYILTPGYIAEADALAQTVGLPASAVDLTVPPPATAPIPAAERTTANLVLVIGNELAGSA